MFDWTSLYPIWGFLALFVLGYLYFLPLITAKRRNHPNTAGIGILNMAFGWTCIGWILAYVWANSAIRTDVTYR
jgi:hypothetical protein